MKVSIRKSKNQRDELTIDQINYASNCVMKYLRAGNDSYWCYEGNVYGVDMNCDVYTTKTQISAIVWFR